MADATKCCGLLGLLAELRNLIYHLVLMKSEPIRPQLKSDLKQERSVLTLLGTCRTIRNKAKAIYNFTKIFRFYDTESDNEHKIPDVINDWSLFIAIEALNTCKHVSLQGVLRATPRDNLHDCLFCSCVWRVEIDFHSRTVKLHESTVCYQESARDIDRKRSRSWGTLVDIGDV